jgi:glycine cleavage system H lipoate-binding protein
MAKINPDKQWKLFNQDIQKYIKENNLYSLGGTYYEMAEFVKNEGKDNSYLIDLGYKMKLKFQIKQLKDVTNSGVTNAVEIIACTNTLTNNACEVCTELNGKVFSVNEALLSNPLPVKNCLYPYGCQCVYGPAFIEKM